MYFGTSNVRKEEEEDEVCNTVLILILQTQQQVGVTEEYSVLQLPLWLNTWHGLRQKGLLGFSHSFSEMWASESSAGQSFQYGQLNIAGRGLAIRTWILKGALCAMFS